MYDKKKEIFHRYIVVNLYVGCVFVRYIVLSNQGELERFESDYFSVSPNFVNDTLLDELIFNFASIYGLEYDISAKDVKKIIFVRDSDYKGLNNCLSSIKKLENNDWLVIKDLGIRYFNKFFNRFSYKKYYFFNIDNNRITLSFLNTGKDIKVSYVLEWANIDDFVEELELIRPYLSKEVGTFELQDIIANMYLGSRFNPTDVIFNDVVRAWITMIIRRILKESKFSALDIDMDSLVVVTGNLINTIDNKNLLLSIIDGIGCPNGFDFLIDKENFVYTLLSGVGEILSFKQDVFNKFVSKNMFRYFTCYLEKFKRSGTAVLGDIISKGNIKQFFVLVNEIRKISVSENDKIKIYAEEGINISNKRKLEFSNINDNNYIFDARINPVVYGPSVNDNRYKVDMWLSLI